MQNQREEPSRIPPELALKSIHVVGIGLEGVAGWSQPVLDLVRGAAVLVGSQRHLDLLGDLCGDQGPEVWILGDLGATIDRLRQWQPDPQASPPLALPPPTQTQQTPKNTRLSYGVVLTSGDPLFFGLGRLLLAHLPPKASTSIPSPVPFNSPLAALNSPGKMPTVSASMGEI